MWRHDEVEAVMSEATIAKTFRFEASHVLPNHAGKCSRPHGHSYVLVVEAAGPVRPADGSSSEGMVLDFSELDLAWKSTVEPLVDHRYLNEQMPNDLLPTTAENIARWLLELFRKRVDQVTAVTVWETATSWARVEAGG